MPGACRHDKIQIIKVNMMLADLHIHTTASDGALAPAAVVRLAQSKGLAALAVTDHDTTAGLEEALSTGNMLTITVVPGIELSTQFADTEIHILGYFLDFRNEPLQNRLADLRADRVNRNKKILKKLRDLGYKLDWERVLALAGEGSVGRPHIALALKEKGYVATVEEGFQKFLNRGAPAFVPRKKLHPQEGIDLIKATGGVAVLAHPGLLGDQRLVKELILAGIQGIEVYYPLHSEDDKRNYLSLCKTYKLIATGGSDFHGIGTESKAEIGAAVVPYHAVQALEKAKGGVGNGAS